jgi:5'-nucleotidase
MRVLVTNDDGLHAPGLIALASALDAAGHEVVAIAPEGDRSGSGAAIGNLVEGSFLRYREMPLAGLDRVQSVELDGPPALCVFAACLGAFGAPPELVASGVNPGLNTGRLTLHSGTVGAALTAANLGLSAVAVSIAGREHSVVHWDVAAALAAEVLRWLPGADPCTVVNLSVPDLPAADLSVARFGTLAPFGNIRAELLARTPGRLEFGFVPTEAALPADSDAVLVSQGHPVVTALTGIRGSEPAGLVEHLRSRTD